MESDSFWRSIVAGQKATDISSNKGNSVQVLGQWPNIGTGAQRACEISVLGDIKNLTSRGPVLSVPCFGQGWHQLTFRGAFKPILVYDPMITS